MSAAPSSRSVRTRLPAWLGGNDILGHAKYAGIHAVPIDASTLRWSIETIENHEGRTPQLATLDVLKTAGGSDHFNFLSSVDDPSTTHTISPEELFAERDRILACQAQSLTSTVEAADLIVSLIDHDSLSQAVSEVYEQFATLEIDNSILFPELSVEFVSFSPLIVRRLSTARALLRVKGSLRF